MNLKIFSIFFISIFVSSLAVSEREVKSSSTKIFDITRYGAKAGKADLHQNTKAINAAIEDAAKSGGIVQFPAGHQSDDANHLTIYRTASIRLRSGVTLELQDGVSIKFSDNFQDYLPMVPIRKSGLDIHNFVPLIYAYNVSDVTIRGPPKMAKNHRAKGAIIDGSGEKWWTFFRVLRDEYRKTGHWNTTSRWHEEFRRANADLIPHHHSLLEPGFLRPSLVYTLYSQRITIQDLTVRDSPFFTINPSVTDHVTIERVRVLNPANAPNTDGIHPESCRHVTIADCFVDTGDDGIVITSSKDNKKGDKLKRPSENITVTDCEIRQGHGGIVLGSGIAGDIRNVRANRLHFDGTLRGIRIKSARGRGGVIENIIIGDVTMHNISHEAITIDAIYDDKKHDDNKTYPVTPDTPVYRDFHLRNVSGDSKLGIRIVGLPEMHFDRIELTNVKMVAKHEEAITIRNVDHLTRSNVTVTIDKHLYDDPKRYRS